MSQTCIYVAIYVPTYLLRRVDVGQNMSATTAAINLNDSSSANIVCNRTPIHRRGLRYPHTQSNRKNTALLFIAINDCGFHSCFTGASVKIYGHFVFYLFLFSLWSVFIKTWGIRGFSYWDKFIVDLICLIPCKFQTASYREILKVKVASTLLFFYNTYENHIAETKQKNAKKITTYFVVATYA